MDGARRVLLWQGAGLRPEKAADLILGTTPLEPEPLEFYRR
jgi:hypothetical protein